VTRVAKVQLVIRVIQDLLVLQGNVAKLVLQDMAQPVLLVTGLLVPLGNGAKPVLQDMAQPVLLVKKVLPGMVDKLDQQDMAQPVLLVMELLVLVAKRVLPVLVAKRVLLDQLVQHTPKIRQLLFLRLILLLIKMILLDPVYLVVTNCEARL
jgi:hypothetical protein